ncbi:MAG: cytochrome b [Gammaproteobacteria bacterium]|nr:cytochrome b [Gammaproteobacteria bacterium]
MSLQPLSKTTILLHWLTGIFLLVVLGLGLYMDELPKGPDKFEIMGIHKSLGLAFLFVALIRVVWRIREGSLPALNVQQTWQDTMAKGIHLFLLLATVLMPVSGLMMSIGGGHGVTFFGSELIAKGEEIKWMGGLGHELHEIGASLIILALLLHIAGALKHEFKLKDGMLSRMLGKKSA